MCRSIKKLRTPDAAVDNEDVRAAALQFVRKISGYAKPSRANEAAFNHAIDEISLASHSLLASLKTVHAKTG